MSFINRICGLGIYHSGKAPAWHTSGSGSALQDYELNRTMDPLSWNCAQISHRSKGKPSQGQQLLLLILFCFHKSFHENCFHRPISIWYLRSSPAYDLSQECSMAKITHTGPSCLTALSAYGFSNRLTAGPTVLICNTVPPETNTKSFKNICYGKDWVIQEGRKMKNRM